MTTASVSLPTLKTALPPTPSGFLQAWFAYCPSDQFLELRAIRAGDRIVRQHFFTLDAIPELYWRACELVEEFDCYFGVCPRIRPQGDKASVTHAPGLWADLDFKRFADGETGALCKLGAFPLPPTWLVATGGGFHVYWQLKEAVWADVNFEGRLKGLVKALNADPAATDRSRVLRIPGSWHQTRNFQVRLIQWPI